MMMMLMIIMIMIMIMMDNDDDDDDDDCNCTAGDVLCGEGLVQRQNVKPWNRISFTAFASEVIINTISP